MKQLKKLSYIALIAIFTAALPVSALAATWLVPGDFSTIQLAINNPLVIQGDRILVGPGEHAGALVTKAVEIKGEDGAIITSGPAHGSGLIQGFRMMSGSDGSSISHLRFKVDLDIMNGEAINDVTVSHCAFDNAIQAVSNWRGSRWEISHNTISDLRTRNGGGIGIFVGDFNGGEVQDNLISHNKISGTLHVPANDGGGYSGTGIVLFADFRWGRTGTTSIAFNRVVKNQVSLVSDKPDVVDVIAFELTDTRDDSTKAVLHDNSIGFNDFRGTVNQVVLTPENLDQKNAISRNLGENRGHGLHPSVFGPGGN